jgi:hypothetical protein
MTRNQREHKFDREKNGERGGEKYLLFSQIREVILDI